MQREARIAVMRDDLESALAKYRAALEVCPDDPLILMALWQLHRRHTLPDEETAKFRSLLIRRLEDPDKEIPPGSLLYLARNPDAEPDELDMTLRAVLARLKAQPDDFRLLEAAGDLYLRLERTEEARSICGRLLELNPSNERRWQCMTLDRREERWEEAFRLIEAIMAEGEPSPLTRMTYIELLGKLGRNEEVLQAVETLIPEEEASSPWAWSLRHELLEKTAWDLRDAGKDEMAERMFRKLLAMEPKSEAIRKVVLHLYGSEEEWESHIAAIEERRSTETDPQMLLYEGANLLASGDAAAAYPLLVRAVPELPDSDIAWFNLGLAAIKLEKFEEAEEALGKAVQLAPGRLDSVFNWGIALFRLGRCEESIQAMQRTLELKPEMYQAHYFLFSCYKDLGDMESANREMKIYNEALERRK